MMHKHESRAHPDTRIGTRRKAQRTAELARREPLLPDSRRGSAAAGVARRGVGGGAAARAEEAASGGRGALLLETLLRQIVEQRLFREAELRPFLSRAERDLAGVEDSETLADVYSSSAPPGRREGDRDRDEL